MAIQNMNNYIASRKVVLVGDTIEDVDRERPISQQLQTIISHIEDLQEIAGRVGKNENGALYLDPLPSSMSEIRIDY